MIAVNMGNGKTQGNGLFSKLKSVFWMFNINVITLNFHTWNKAEIPNLYKYIYTNLGKKDLVINNNVMPLYHLSINKINSFQEVSIEKLKDNDKFMFCTDEKIEIYTDNISGKGILISIGLKNPKLSTAEI